MFISLSLRYSLALVAIGLSSSSLAQSNDLIGKQVTTTRKYWINNNVPVGCRNAAYLAAMAWASSTFKAGFTWAGYTSATAFAPNASGVNVTQTTNTLDTVSEVGALDTVNVNAWGQTNYRVAAGSGTANPNWKFSDGDHLINANKIATGFYCGTSTTVPSAQRDMQSHTLHELGHVWGLDHDLTDIAVAPATTGVTVMYQYGVTGVTTRVLHAKDIGRMTTLYGAKP
jgi:hypothetical protein